MDEDVHDKPELKLASSPCLSGERLSFTGRLASMTHRQASEISEEYGGAATVHVSKQTTMLVVGEEGWPLEEDGKPSVKLQQVTEWRQQGLNMRVLPESEWLHLLGLEERRRELHRLLTPAMLSQSLKVSVSLIRHWERIGLIRPVKKVFRLPYFDFGEVACVRRLAELLQAGISQHELEVSLGRLQSMLPGAERSLTQLTLLARDRHVVLRDATGIVEPTTRQRLFDFDLESRLGSATNRRVDADDEPAILPYEQLVTNSAELSTPENEPGEVGLRISDDWFDRGVRLLEAGQASDAVEAFRLAVVDRAIDPEAHFHLAEALYRAGNLAGAFERFHVAAELDQQYLEAWTQLGCVAVELGQTDAALDAFQIAIKCHASYPDAHFHLAELLHGLNRSDEAVSHWQAYLDQDQRGPWADVARQRLETLANETR